MDRQILS